MAHFPDARLKDLSQSGHIFPAYGTTLPKAFELVAPDDTGLLRQTQEVSPLSLSNAELGMTFFCLPPFRVPIHRCV